MLYGPDIIKECSKCNKLISEISILSGNTFGAKYYTDGKMEAPSLPACKDLVKCPHCESMIYLSKQEEIKESFFSFLFPYRKRKDLNEAMPYLNPVFDDYINHIKVENDSDKIKYLRLLAWYCSNDLRRKDNYDRNEIQYQIYLDKIRNAKKSEEKMKLLEDPPNYNEDATEDDYQLNDVEIDNLKKLLNLLNESKDKDRIMKAEIFRELGDFDLCISLLEEKFNDEGMDYSAKFIKNLALKKIAKVEIIN